MVHPLIQPQLDRLHKLCEQHHVRRLDLVGSASRNDFSEQQSDLHFLVTFEPGATRGFHGDYFSLREALEDLFRRRVDLIEEEAIRNPYLRRSLESDRVTLYGQSP